MDDDARLKDLSDRIAAAKGQPDEAPPEEARYAGAEVAWRMVLELTAGIGVGFAMGYGLDTLFGTMPILLVVFIGFGLVAGIRLMMRTAREVQERQAAKSKAETEGTGDGD
ncbi:MAG: AtpZ/AtpI family protein [Shimia sp.]